MLNQTLLLFAALLLPGCVSRPPVDLRPLVVYQTAEEWGNAICVSQCYQFDLQNLDHLFGQTPSEIFQISKILVWYPKDNLVPPTVEQALSAVNDYVLVSVKSGSSKEPGAPLTWIEVFGPEYGKGKSLVIYFRNGIPVSADLKKGWTIIGYFKLKRKSQN
ncbi:MAG: hypothetical protein QM715_01370 [Nibricoccus sp.]